MAEDRKEYIERGQVLEITNRLSNEPYYQHNGETFYAGVSAVDLEILTIPTADVAEVVYCRECKHCDPENKHCDHPMGTTLPVPREDNDFCSYGERKDK